MGSTLEALGTKNQGLRSSMLKRGFSLTSEGTRLVVNPDGSVERFHSLAERRAIFGVERVAFFKLQAGVVVPSQRVEWGVRASPQMAQFVGRSFDAVEVAQALEFFRGGSVGYIRRVRLKNLGSAPMKVRLVGISDPSAAQLRGESGPWGSLGLNAFNRGSHVAMDEVADVPSARVAGAIPQPSRFYLTTDRSRALELFSSGELPESTAGMSGQVLILSSQDVEIAPSESKEITFAFVYNQMKLEDALSDFSKVKAGDRGQRPRLPYFATSSPIVTEASGWAVLTLLSSRFAGSLLDRLESVQGIAFVDQQQARALVESLRSTQRPDGAVPHSEAPTRGGVLETSLFVGGASKLLLALQDKKASRALYPSVRKGAVFLVQRARDDAVSAEGDLPCGWRREVGTGFPSGVVPEVALAAATALELASQVSAQVGKTDDAGKFKEKSELIRERVRKSLMDDRGYLALCLDSTGRLRSDDTADMGVAGFRGGLPTSAEQAIVHRLLEKDFETPYGPRTVPSSNQVYFNRTYGSGQLGGFWPRAALAHALLCYRVGLGGIGGLGLQKVARLPTEDAPKLGGAPGAFPYWVDVEGQESHGDGSDPVTASRFILGLVEGELGLAVTGQKVTLSPPASSVFKWVLARDVWSGESVSAFVGRSGGKEHCFFSGGRVECRGGVKFPRAEPLELGVRGLHGVSFIGQQQVFCMGNESASQARTTVKFSPKLQDAAKHLSVSLESYDQTKGSWSKVGTIRLSPEMSFEATVGPGDWRAFRISTI